MCGRALSESGSLVTPQGYLDYLRAQGVPPAALEVAPLVLAGWGSLGGGFVRASRACRRRRWPYDAEWPYYDARGFGVTRLPTGAPAAAFLLDQLVACGASSLLGAGVAGSLAPDLRPGTVLVVEEALAGDGTSPHYRPAAAEEALPGSPNLVGHLATALAAGGAEVEVGRAWSTDAPFGETPALLGRARARGALAVDMETAAVYAMAARRGVAACSVLVITDGVWERWEPAFGTPAVRRALEVVAAALPEAAAALATAGLAGGRSP